MIAPMTEADLAEIDRRIALYTSPVHRGNPTAARYVDHATALLAEVQRLRKIAQAARELIDALPKCVKCGKQAMREYPAYAYAYCDDCGAISDRKYPHAESLRRLIALVSK